MAKKWMSKYSQQLFLLAVLFIIFAVLAGKSEYFLTWKNMRNILEAASYRMVLAVGMTFVISSGVMDLSAGSIVSLCGVLTALALHGGMGIWASVLTGIAAGGLMGALNGVLIHCTGINFFVLTLASSGMLRGISLMITDGKPITKFGKEFMQLGIPDSSVLSPDVSRKMGKLRTSPGRQRVRSEAVGSANRLLPHFGSHAFRYYGSRHSSDYYRPSEFCRAKRRYEHGAGRNHGSDHGRHTDSRWKR